MGLQQLHRPRDRPCLPAPKRRVTHPHFPMSQTRKSTTPEPWVPAHCANAAAIISGPLSSRSTRGAVSGNDSLQSPYRGYPAGIPRSCRIPRCPQSGLLKSSVTVTRSSRGGINDNISVRRSSAWPTETLGDVSQVGAQYVTDLPDLGQFSAYFRRRCRCRRSRRASAAAMIVVRASWRSAGSGSAAVRLWLPARMVTVR